MDNIAYQSGGGVYAYQSDVTIKIASKDFLIHNNTASQGGGMHTLASTLKVLSDSIVTYTYNKAINKGGALALEQNSKIYTFRALENSTKVQFYYNSALMGGAIFISDDTSDRELCKQMNNVKQLTFQTECFFQALSLDHEPPKYSTIFFVNNTSEQGNGDDLFGGLLDRCTLNEFAEQSNQSGLKYFSDVSKFNELHISETELRNHIASEAVQLCFCVNEAYDCSIIERDIPVKRGELFQVNVTAVDHSQNQVKSKVIATFSFNSIIGHFKENQSTVEIGNTCTLLEYNLYSEEPSLQVEIYADGPCKADGISKRLLNVTFEPCDCPVGFGEAPDSPTECRCECAEDLLTKIPTITCYADEELVELSLSTDLWVKYINETNSSQRGFLSSLCPYDYCTRPVNISFNDTDKQCAHNRSSLLCGKCIEEHSMVLGSFRCKECTDSWLALILLFAVFGIVLVAVILLLNITVATGAVNGLIFYSNTVGISQLVFIPKSGTVLKVFISWLNLDWGIETCFYNGMDAYSKVFLQLVFPCYLVSLIIFLIAVSEHSRRFAALLGNKNPVAALCTLILLTYSKLARMVTTVLQFASLKYPNSTTILVWQYDANVRYFQKLHIPLFVIAIIIIVLGIVYTSLLLLGQWLPQLPNRKLTRWINHPKYNAFIDAYHTPFVPKHRYWAGLLLLARIVHIMVQSLGGDEGALLAVAVISILLLFLKTINTKTYKNRMVEVVDNSFFVNLTLLSVCLYYLKVTEGDPSVIITISTSIAFASFIALLCYYSYSNFFKRYNIGAKIHRLFQSAQRPRYDLANAYLQDDDDNEPQDPLVAMDTLDKQQDFTEDTDREPLMKEPNLYDPPIITSALKLDELREPALDIIDPITSDHYKQSASQRQPPARLRQQVTHTLIDKLQ